MGETPIRAVEMVRAIRDEIYEETKDLSREELKEFFAREAAAMRKESQQSRPPQRAAKRRQPSGEWRRGADLYELLPPASRLRSWICPAW